MEELDDEANEVSGIKALLSLISTLVDSAKPDDATSLVTAIAQATGVLAYLQNEVVGVERDHPLFKKGMLEGSEMAVVFASNFKDLDMPGVIWVSLHEVNPEDGGVSLLGGRERALIVDLNGEGDRVNITSIDFDIPDDIDSELHFLGMWGSQDGDDLIEAGSLQTPLALKDRKHLSLSPGGLRLKKPAVR